MLKSLNKVHFLVGNTEYVEGLRDISPLSPFDESIVGFLNDFSKILLNDKNAKQYSDIMTFAFWIRKNSLIQLKREFYSDDGNVKLGKGVAFHVAPSNVPVNFAYSLVTGLLSGNANIVRVPSKNFEQITIISDAINRVLEKHESVRKYIILVRYDRDKDINDDLSSVADIRIVWGGDATITELRKSILPPRSGEITFADRYSFAVIDSDAYMELFDKDRVASDFYNDTYLFDQNACTSPRIVVWMGTSINQAKKTFWSKIHRIVKEKYKFQSVQAISKLTSAYLASVAIPGSRVEDHSDNLLIRIKVPEASGTLMRYRDSGGFFFEYDCRDILEIREICNDKRCQTIGYIGDKSMFIPLMQSGIKGVDRIVPIGRTMDFSLIWDGYNLMNMLTRIVSIG